MLLAVIVDQMRVTAWQAEALLRVVDTNEFILLNCTNTRSRRRMIKHILYYALNFLSLRTRLTQLRPIPSELRVLRVSDFEAEDDGVWQKLPKEVVEQLKEFAPFAIVKMGMGLLRVPADLSIPILSYHHGDPRYFRGRPAGFYEMLSGETVVGQVVQILSSRLDGGSVVAFAQSRVHAHSYRSTMREAYGISPLLLPTALSNVCSSRSIELAADGKNFRLPSNPTVLRFILRVIAAALWRLKYGLVYEKRWEVAETMVQESASSLFAEFPTEGSWQRIRCPTNYRFIADPFFETRGDGVLVEALREVDGQGEIILIRPDGSVHLLCSGPGHYSYPCTLLTQEGEYLLPEMSEWSAQHIFQASQGHIRDLGKLKIEGDPPLIDPTLHYTGDRFFLFGNDGRQTAPVLRLWLAGNIFDRFVEHAASPIVLSPVGARMGGNILSVQDRRFRVGQDLTGSYGDGLRIFEITALTDTEYAEREVAAIRFSSHRGPHTLNIQGTRCIFDFYSDRVSMLAGLRRLRSRVKKRRIARESHRPVEQCKL